MNIIKLKQAETDFFEKYPDGFESPEMKEISKKHKVKQMVKLAHKTLSPEALVNVQEASESIIKLVTRSSMVSLFEKPKFRDAVRMMNNNEKSLLAEGVFNLLHGDEETGFNQLVDLLLKYKLAKWTLVTVFRCYYYPNTDLLYKPTTVKNIIKTYELENLAYKPRPTYDFFVLYRNTINEMKNHVHESLSPNNAAFSGFLMMTM
jgi:hypothetical protein